MQLPDGRLAVVKRDCPTCELVAPVLGQLELVADDCSAQVVAAVTRGP